MKDEKYSRYEFLRKMGFQGGALMAVLASCTHDGDAVLDSLIVNNKGEKVAALDSTNKTGTTPATSGSSSGTTSGGTTTGGTSSTTLPIGKVATSDLAKVSNPLVKVDLTLSSSSVLANTGGYITVNNAIVIGRTADGSYVAASNLCTHEPKRRVIFNKTEYFCTDHGARFSLTGANLNTIARSPLTVYKTANDGKTLIVYA